MTCRCCGHPILTFGWPGARMRFPIEGKRYLQIMELLCVPCALWADRILGIHGICIR